MTVQKGGWDYFQDWMEDNTTTSDGSDASLVVVDGLTATQSILNNGTYNTTTIKAVAVITAGGANTLILSPSSGDADITITAAQLAAMSFPAMFYGPYDEVTAGADVTALIYTN